MSKQKEWPDPDLTIVLRGDPLNGFKLYGPFETPTWASYKTILGDVVDHMNPPGRCPREDMDDNEYIANVVMDGNAWVVVRGKFDEGFRFMGPYYEDDAADVRDRIQEDDPTAIICELYPATEL